MGVCGLTRVYRTTTNWVIQRQDLRLKSHPKDRTNKGSILLTLDLTILISSPACFPLLYHRSSLLNKMVSYTQANKNKSNH